MQVEGVTVQKIIEPKLLGVFKAHNVYLCHGKYGEYLRHNSVNYSIPEWAKMENLKEPFGIAQASNIIDWKMKNPIVPKGAAVCKNEIVIKKFADVSENEWLSTTDCIGIHEIISV
jgi:hypothetical protein